MEKKLILSHLKDFLNRDDIMEALEQNNFSYIYSQFDIAVSYTVPTFTKLLLEEGIDFLSDVSIIPISCFQDLVLYEELIIPENITAIGDYAFCSTTCLYGLVIPETVKYMAWSCFNMTRCDNVVFKGTKEDFMNMKSGGMYYNIQPNEEVTFLEALFIKSKTVAAGVLADLTIHCSDGDIVTRELYNEWLEKNK